MWLSGLPLGQFTRFRRSTRRSIRKCTKGPLVCEQLEKRILLATNILVDPNNGLPASSLLLQYIVDRYPGELEHHSFSLSRLPRGRTPEATGFAYWTGQLNSNVLTRTEIERDFVLGSEAAGAAVDSFYIDYLQRVSDAQGRAFFVQQISTGNTSYASVAEMLLASDEFLQ